MSLAFSTICTQIDSNCGTNSTSYPTAQKVRDINLTLDRFIELALTASGKWQFDDQNHTKYNIITTNLVLNQRDYSFTADEQSNLILDIYKVMVKDASDIWRELRRVDQQQEDSADNPVLEMLESDIDGLPDKYDKTGSAIFLDPRPSYNSTNGLKVWISREGSYFTTDDTTKKPGVPGILHEYFTIRPTAYYMARKRPQSAGFWMNELSKWEGDASIGRKGIIQKYFAGRAKDEQLVITSSDVNPF